MFYGVHCLEYCTKPARDSSVSNLYDLFGGDR